MCDESVTPGTTFGIGYLNVVFCGTSTARRRVSELSRGAEMHNKQLTYLLGRGLWGESVLMRVNLSLVIMIYSRRRD